MDDLRVVFESTNRAACSDRALVLAAVQIPHQVVADHDSCALVVPAEFSAQAVAELRLYDQENPPPVHRPKPSVEHYDPVPGVIAYLAVIVLVAWFDGLALFGENWRAAGRIDGELLRQGEWWRTITALTLHSGLPHLTGNIVFGALFGIFAGRLLGSGVAWLVIVLSAACGNVLNTLLLDSTHKSIGASTAVFAALGLTAGYVWRARLMSQERWPYRVGPIVGGFALLMYTGTGDANTDIGAHLMGFLAGFGAGMLMTLATRWLGQPKLQFACGAGALALIALAWRVAL